MSARSDSNFLGNASRPSTAGPHNQSSGSTAPTSSADPGSGLNDSVSPWLPIAPRSAGGNASSADSLCQFSETNSNSALLHSEKFLPTAELVQSTIGRERSGFAPVTGPSADSWPGGISDGDLFANKAAHSDPANCLAPARGAVLTGRMPQEATEKTTLQRPQSWPFRWARGVTRFANAIAGFSGMVVLLAVVANVPLLSFLSFGFLLEVSGRVARTGRWRDGFPGLQTAGVFGRGLLGTFLCFLPVILVGNTWYAAYLIDPESSQTNGLRIAQIVLLVLTIGHVLAAWFCGGRLRQFLWPLVAPFSLGLWLFRRMLGTSILRPLVRGVTWPISKHLADDLAQTQPLRDWFLPATVGVHLWRGTLWSSARDKLWNVAAEIPWRRLITLGTCGFLGSFLILAPSTFLLIWSTDAESGANVVMGLVGAAGATLVFAILLTLQTQFAATNNWRDLFNLRGAWRVLRRAPIWNLLSVTTALILALPLFFAKIEEIPRELLWTLSLLFVAVGWLSRVVAGWAFYRGTMRSEPRAWWWGIPVNLLHLPVAFAFVFIMFFTRYLSWHGAWSMLENPVFLLPAPFWL